MIVEDYIEGKVEVVFIFIFMFFEAIVNDMGVSVDVVSEVKVNKYKLVKDIVVEFNVNVMMGKCF